VSPILVRPVREQLEHDRIIRQLQAKFKRKFEALINPGSEQNAPVGNGPQALFPDVVLMSLERGRKLMGVIEVETGESVNHLEALAEWAHLGRIRAPFHLYVPAGMVEVARRLCEDNQVGVSEIWSFHTVGDQVRFTMVHRAREVPKPPPGKFVGSAVTRPAQPKPPAPKPPAAKPVAAKPVAAKPVVAKPVVAKPVAAKAAPAKAAPLKPSKPVAKTATSRKAAPPKKKPAGKKAAVNKKKK
jgi:hypothetical protein